MADQNRLGAVGATLLYGIASILITTINKSVLTTYRYIAALHAATIFTALDLQLSIIQLSRPGPSKYKPVCLVYTSFLQIVATILILGLARSMCWIDFPAPSREQLTKVRCIVVYVCSIIHVVAGGLVLKALDGRLRVRVPSVADLVYGD